MNPMLLPSLGAPSIRSSLLSTRHKSLFQWQQLQSLSYLPSCPLGNHFDCFESLDKNVQGRNYLPLNQEVCRIGQSQWPLWQPLPKGEASMPAESSEGPVEVPLLSRPPKPHLPSSGGVLAFPLRMRRLVHPVLTGSKEMPQLPFKQMMLCSCL